MSDPEARVEITFEAVIEGTLSELGLDEESTGVKLESAADVMKYLKEEYQVPGDLYKEWGMDDEGTIDLLFWPADPAEDERKPGPGQLPLTEGVASPNPFPRPQVAYWWR